MAKNRFLWINIVSLVAYIFFLVTVMKFRVGLSWWGFLLTPTIVGYASFNKKIILGTIFKSIIGMWIVLAVYAALFLSVVLSYCSHGGYACGNVPKYKAFLAYGGETVFAWIVILIFLMLLCLFGQLVMSIIYKIIDRQKDL